MSGIAKTLVTVGVVVLAIILFAAVVGVRNESDDKNDNNTSILQK